MLLIDGYNLLFCVRGFDPKRMEEARNDLVWRIAAHCAATGRRARVFFDPGRGGHGLRSVRKGPGIEVVQLAEMSADDAIRELVADSSDRTEYRVVSSDREVAGAAERKGFSFMASEQFLAELEAGERGTPIDKPTTCDPAEAEYWMRIFGMGGKQT